ncbi:MAG TPA: Fur family transcriptional regulator [Candidatus Micrarchaeaceae archaeon]|nr:Fur family transcriptional regulator [Candidatus Micrarchaeaceae archaeon]
MNGLETLRQQGKRLTPQRRLVYGALLEHPGHATADELCNSIGRKLPGFQRTTVYRTLDLLVEIGLARKVQLGHANTYEAVMAGSESHQHLVCDRCGGTFDVSCPEVPEWVESAAQPLGFDLERVELLGHGTCAGCAATLA